MSDRTEYLRAYNAAHREDRRAWRAANPEAVREYGRRHRERHKEEISVRDAARFAAHPEYRERQRTYNAAHPEKIRDSYLRSFYGLTAAQYDALLAAQGGACAICRKPETIRDTKTGVVRRLHVDHDHRCCPGKTSCGRCVRGLLCGRCNQGGGQFGDDPALLRAAVDYFERSA